MEILIRVLLLATFVFGLELRAQSLAEWKARMVKIQQGDAEGSGFFIGESIVTSEHVVLKENRDSIFLKYPEGSAGKESKGYIQHHSYDDGLAILNNYSRIAVDWVDRGFDMKAEEIKDKEFFALGFPAGTQELRVIGPGQLNEGASRRALIPGVKEMLELRNLPVEFGMSGGALLVRVGEDDYRLAGMISHQFLKRQGGAMTKIQPLESKSEGMAQSDLTFAIPASFVRTWYGDNMNRFGVRIVRKMGADKKIELIYGPLRFRMAKVKPGELEVNGVGGADGSGVGGIQGFSTRESVVVEVSANQDWNNVYDSNAELKKWNEALIRHRKLYVLRMVSASGEVKPLGSLDQFVTLWKRDGLRPVFASGNLEDICHALSATRVKTANLRAGIRRVRDAELNPSVRSWLEKLVEDSYMIDNRYLEPKILGKYLEPSEDGFWSTMLMADFDAVADLQAMLADLAGSK